MTLQDDIIDFRNKYGLPIPDQVGRISPEDLSYRLGHIEEEVRELNTAVENEDIVEMADALVDIVYVTIGTAMALGINFQACWDEIHRSNMAKQRAKPDGSDSKRGSGLDIVKPPGWQPPDLVHCLYSEIKNSPEPILKRAHDIIDNRTEEKERQYGSMSENCRHAAQIAGIMQNKHFNDSDVMAILAGLKLARHNRSYKQDSLLDAVAYLGALDNYIQEFGDDRC